MAEFREWPKIPRLYREVVVTEKIDGTNACVIVDEDGTVSAQSRSRIITPESDNYGFARWVKENEEQLRFLGPGHHFGEWWGAGIQRRYELDHKRFSLFNVHRWAQDGTRPGCCDVVPILFQGTAEQAFDVVAVCLGELELMGSRAAPGFMKPEGVIAYHTAGGHYYKAFLENDSEPKSRGGQ